MSIKGLSGIVAAFFIPCLFLSNTLRVFSLSDVKIWLPILLIMAGTVSHGQIVASRIAGLLSGYILGKHMFLASPATIRVLMSTVGFSHSTLFQLLLIETLKGALSLMKPLMPDLHFQLTIEDRGIHYVVLSSIISTIFLWTLGY